MVEVAGVGMPLSQAKTSWVGSPGKAPRASMVASKAAWTAAADYGGGVRASQADIAELKQKHGYTCADLESVGLPCGFDFGAAEDETRREQAVWGALPWVAGAVLLYILVR